MVFSKMEGRSELKKMKQLKSRDNNNKRAQRALGRSPEETVKGHSGATYREPLMLSTKYR